MNLFLATLFIFGFVIFIMAIGVIFGNRRIEGSCGGIGGCDFCLFKNGRNCDSSSSCDKDGEHAGNNKACEVSCGESEGLSEKAN